MVEQVAEARLGLVGLAIAGLIIFTLTQALWLKEAVSKSNNMSVRNKKAFMLYLFRASVILIVPH
jgi:hypothetical protein